MDVLFRESNGKKPDEVRQRHRQRRIDSQIDSRQRARFYEGRRAKQTLAQLAPTVFSGTLGTKRKSSRFVYFIKMQKQRQFVSV